MESWSWLRDDVEERGDESIRHVECWNLSGNMCHALHFCWPQRVRDMHAPTGASGLKQWRRERRGERIRVTRGASWLAVWIYLILCLGESWFFLTNSQNKIGIYIIKFYKSSREAIPLILDDPFKTKIPELNFSYIWFQDITLFLTKRKKKIKWAIIFN